MTRVVKLGGRAQQDPQLPAALALLCREWPGRVCLVHGGGDEVSQLQRRMGMEPRFVGGRRVTSAADLEVVRMVLSGTVNKRLVSALLAHDVDAVGLSGARPAGPRPRPRGPRRPRRARGARSRDAC